MRTKNRLVSYLKSIPARVRLWWKQEGTRFKYFRNKADQKAFARNLDSLDRVDKIIKEDVESALNKAEERSKKLAQN